MRAKSKFCSAISSRAIRRCLRGSMRTSLFGVPAQPAKDAKAAHAKRPLIGVLAGSSQVGLDNVFGFFMDGAAITAGRFRERFMRLH